jgi:hypothetical protein
MSLRQVDELSSLVLLDGVDLISHCRTPCLLLFCFCNCAWLAGANHVQLPLEIALRKPRHWLFCSNHTLNGAVADRRVTTVRCIKALFIIL